MILEITRIVYLRVKGRSAHRGLGGDAPPMGSSHYHGVSLPSGVIAGAQIAVINFANSTIYVGMVFS